MRLGQAAGAGMKAAGRAMTVAAGAAGRAVKEVFLAHYLLAAKYTMGPKKQKTVVLEAEDGDAATDKDVKPQEAHTPNTLPLLRQCLLFPVVAAAWLSSLLLVPGVAHIAIAFVQTARSFLGLGLPAHLKSQAFWRKGLLSVRPGETRVQQLLRWVYGWPGVILAFALVLVPAVLVLTANIIVQSALSFARMFLSTVCAFLPSKKFTLEPVYFGPDPALFDEAQTDFRISERNGVGRIPPKRFTYGLPGVVLGAVVGFVLALPIVAFRVILNSALSFCRTAASIIRASLSERDAEPGEINCGIHKENLLQTRGDFMEGGPLGLSNVLPPARFTYGLPGIALGAAVGLFCSALIAVFYRIPARTISSLARACISMAKFAWGDFGVARGNDFTLLNLNAYQVDPASYDQMNGYDASTLASELKKPYEKNRIARFTYGFVGVVVGLLITSPLLLVRIMMESARSFAVLTRSFANLIEGRPRYVKGVGEDPREPKLRAFGTLGYVLAAITTVPFILVGLLFKKVFPLVFAFLASPLVLLRRVTKSKAEKKMGAHDHQAIKDLRSAMRGDGTLSNEIVPGKGTGEKTAFIAARKVFTFNYTSIAEKALKFCKHLVRAMQENSLKFELKAMLRALLQVNNGVDARSSVLNASFGEARIAVKIDKLDDSDKEEFMAEAYRMIQYICQQEAVKPKTAHAALDEPATASDPCEMPPAPVKINETFYCSHSWANLFSGKNIIPADKVRRDIQAVVDAPAPAPTA
ncbi:MAG: hypothetical protein HY939_00710 [Gammaproteobacteria bacterium]|nr:hypothetical protein [Gammaproteobacteria bacterium]